MVKTVIIIFLLIKVILGLYITEVGYLTKIDEIFKFVIPLYGLSNYKIPLKLISEECLVNQNSLLALRNNFGNKLLDKVKILYFGNETCENLIPTKEIVEKVLSFCNKNNYQFSYITPYVGPNGLIKVKTNLDFLEKNMIYKNKIEIVFNDFGVLNLLQKYEKLIPVLGRLLIKTKRDPRYLNTDYCRNKEKISKFHYIKTNQLEAIGQGSLGIKDYQSLLKKNGVRRVSLDISNNISNIDNKVFPMDIYWPWTYITSGRACQIAAINNPLLKYHPVNHSCRYECKRYQYVLKTTDNTTSMHKGNALWMDSTNLIGQIYNNRFKRLIYQPYIPI